MALCPYGFMVNWADRPLFFEEADGFANPEDKGGPNDYPNPIHKSQRGHIEELSSELDYQDLSAQDYQRNYRKTGAILEMECRAAAHKRTSVEHIPELQEHEYREEEAQFIRRQGIFLAKV